MDSGFDHATQPRTLAQKPPLWLLVLILGSGTVGITIISPTLKAIAEDFRVEDSLTQWLLSGYFIAVAFSQLVYGPLSDRYGRKAPLLTGLALYVIGGAAGALAPSMEWLIAARVLQGLGAAAIMSIVRAIVNDSYERTEGAAAFGAITAVMAIVPIFSFISGGLISELIGWRGTMVVIGIIGTVSLLMVLLFLWETNLDPLERFEAATLTREYAALITNRAFLAFAIASACSAGIFFCLIGFIPYEYARLGVGAGETGVWFALTPLGYMAGNFCTRQFTRRAGIEAMLLIGSLVCLLAAGMLLVVSQMPDRTPLMITVPCMVFGVSAGLVIPNGTMGAIGVAGRLGGSASGIAGALQMGFGVLGGFIIVTLGGYEQAFRGILVLLGFAVVAVVSSLSVLRVTPGAET